MTMKIVYLLGTPYCGSSLFALALGTDPHILNLGEVIFMENDAEGGRCRCSCGVTLRNCPFWAPLLPHYGPGGSGGLVLTEPKTRRLDPLDGSRLGPRGDTAAYRHKAVRFFETVGAWSGAAVLVDASKNPRRLRQLLADPRLDVVVVRLTRPFWEVAASYRARGRGVWRLLAARLATDLAYGRVPPSRRLSLTAGELAQNPDGVAQKMSRLLDRPVRFALKAGVLDTSGAHVFTGNRWMFEKPLTSVALRPATPTTAAS